MRNYIHQLQIHSKNRDKFIHVGGGGKRECCFGGTGLFHNLVQRAGGILKAEMEVVNKGTGGSERTGPESGEGAEAAGVLVARLPATLAFGVGSGGAASRRAVAEPPGGALRRQG